MTDFDDRSRESAPFAADSASGLAMVLLQLAACRAEIGPFARFGRETPREAAARYRGIVAGSSLGRRNGLLA